LSTIHLFIFHCDTATNKKSIAGWGESKKDRERKEGREEERN